MPRQRLAFVAFVAFFGFGASGVLFCASAMNPYFVQAVSSETDPYYGYKHRRFTNLSSQMMDPGSLPAFFRRENTAERMPFSLADIPENDGGVLDQFAQSELISEMPRSETMPRFFEDETGTKLRRFRTDSMRAWGVPLAMTEVRETDMMY